MDNIIELDITTTIQIDIEDLVDKTGLEAQSDAIDIEDALNDYIESVDDTEFYLIGPKEINIVTERVREYLDSMNGED